MKNLLITVSLGLILSAQASALAVTSGDCRLETSNEIINLQNIDPFTHFGMFAKGSSSFGDYIYLQLFSDAIRISIDTKSASSHSIVTLADSGPTSVRMGTSVRREGVDTAEWLSCNLQVQ